MDRVKRDQLMIFALTLADSKLGSSYLTGGDWLRQ